MGSLGTVNYYDRDAYSVTLLQLASRFLASNMRVEICMGRGSQQARPPISSIVAEHARATRRPRLRKADGSEVIRKAAQSMIISRSYERVQTGRR